MPYAWYFQTPLGERLTCCLRQDLGSLRLSDEAARPLSPRDLEILLLGQLEGVARDVTKRDLLALYEALNPLERWRAGPSETPVAALVASLVEACWDGRLLAFLTPAKRWTVSFAPEPAPAAVELSSPERAWIEIVVQDEDGEPLAERPLSVGFPDGSSQDVATDARGRFRRDDLTDGTCSVRLARRASRSTLHTAARGECLTSIAAHYGFADYRQIYEDGGNADFRKLRPDPHVIKAGDKVSIPEIPSKVYALSTGKTHIITVRLPKRLVRIVLKGLPASLIAGKSFQLLAGSRTVDGRVTGDGMVEARMPATVEQATLTIEDLGLSVDLAIGDLDPVHDGDPSNPVAAGIQARLANLGRYAANMSGEMDDATIKALAAFQRDVMGRENAAGEVDGETLDALVREHGC